MAGRPSSPRGVPCTPPPPRSRLTSPGSPDASSRRNRSAAAPNTFTARNLQFSPMGVPPEAPAHSPVIDRPDRAEFPSSKTDPKPNFEPLPSEPPPPSSGRPRPGSGPPASGVQKPESPRPRPRACGGLQTKRLRRRRGRQDRPLGDSSEPAAASPHRWLRGPGSRARRCSRPTNNGWKRRRRPRLGPSAARGPAGCWRTDGLTNPPAEGGSERARERAGGPGARPPAFPPRGEAGPARSQPARARPSPSVATTL
nr:uncharacterized protein LOC111770301 [Equus caballus]